LGTASAIAIGVMGASILNPFFDPRVALTAYPDMSSGVMLALCLVACWRSLDDTDTVWRVRIAATAVVLVLLRESNVAFIVGLAGGLLLMGRRAWGTLPALVIPAVAAFVLWRLYLWSAAIPPALVPHPVAEWNWRAPIAVVSVLVTDRLMANPLLGLAAFAVLAVLAALIFRWFRRGDASLRALLFLVAVVTASWILFLAASYVAVLPYEAARGGDSIWRYITHLGPTLTFVLFAVGRANAPPTSSGPTVTGVPSPWSMHPIAIAAIACLIPGALTLATWRYWKIDCRHPELTVTRLMARSMPPIGETAVIQVNTVGWEALVIHYQLHRQAGATHQISSTDAALKEGYLLDLGELTPDRLHDPQYSPTATLSRWTGTSWQGEIARAFRPNEYACRFW